MEMEERKVEVEVEEKNDRIASRKSLLPKRGSLSTNQGHYIVRLASFPKLSPSPSFPKAFRKGKKKEK